MKKEDVGCYCIIMTLVCAMLIVSIPSAKAQFVLSSWNDDDGFGQGIDAVWVYENSTGVWLPILDPAFVLPQDETVIEMNETENTAIRLIPAYTLNHSLQNIPNGEEGSDEGINIMRCGIVVKVLGAIVFSQENITLVYGGQEITGGEPISIHWYYAPITIPILIRSGLIYVVELTYEVYPYLYE